MPQMRKRQAFAAVIVVCSFTLTACSYGDAPSTAPTVTPATGGATAATGAATPTTGLTRPRVTQPAIATAAQSATVDAAKTIAHQFFNSYSNGQYAFAWALLDRSDQRAIPKATWVAVHDGCPNAVAGLAYRISGVTIAGSTAAVTYTSQLGRGSQTFIYSGSNWRLALSDLDVYRHGSVKADIAAAKVHPNCL
jgi:hypothetical protein